VDSSRPVARGMLASPAMGHRTTRRPGKRQQVNRPSTFFIIALATGLIVLVIMAVVLIRRPAVKRGSLESRGAAVARAA
jgi:hypothetical protein